MDYMDYKLLRRSNRLLRNTLRICSKTKRPIKFAYKSPYVNPVKKAMGNYGNLIAPMKTNGVSIDISFHMSKNKMDSSRKWSAPPPPKNVWGAAASQPLLKSAATVARWFFQPTFERNIVLKSIWSLHIHHKCAGLTLQSTARSVDNTVAPSLYYKFKLYLHAIHLSNFSWSHLAQWYNLSLFLLDQSQSVEKSGPPHREPLWNTTSVLVPPRWNTVGIDWASPEQSESVE